MTDYETVELQPQLQENKAKPSIETIADAMEVLLPMAKYTVVEEVLMKMKEPTFIIMDSWNYFYYVWSVALNTYLYTQLLVFNEQFNSFNQMLSFICLPIFLGFKILLSIYFTKKRLQINTPFMISIFGLTVEFLEMANINSGFIVLIYIFCGIVESLNFKYIASQITQFDLMKKHTMNAIFLGSAFSAIRNFSPGLEWIPISVNLLVLATSPFFYLYNEVDISSIKKQVNYSNVFPIINMSVYYMGPFVRFKSDHFTSETEPGLIITRQVYILVFIVYFNYALKHEYTKYTHYINKLMYLLIAFILANFVFDIEPTEDFALNLLQPFVDFYTLIMFYSEYTILVEVHHLYNLLVFIAMYIILNYYISDYDFLYYYYYIATGYYIVFLSGYYYYLYKYDTSYNNHLKLNTKTTNYDNNQIDSDVINDINSKSNSNDSVYINLNQDKNDKNQSKNEINYTNENTLSTIKTKNLSNSEQIMITSFGQSKNDQNKRLDGKKNFDKKDFTQQSFAKSNTNKSNQSRKRYIIDEEEEEEDDIKIDSGSYYFNKKVDLDTNTKKMNLQENDNDCLSISNNSDQDFVKLQDEIEQLDELNIEVDNEQTKNTLK